MQLLRSKIVPPEVDAFWQGLPQRWQEQPPVDMLVVTYVYEPETIEETTLVRLLQACGYKPGSNCAIITTGDSEQVAWHAIADHFLARYVLLFGIDPSAMGIAAHFQHYTPTRFGKSTFVLAPTLMQLAQDANAKKALWDMALKPMFAGTKNG